MILHRTGYAILPTAVLVILGLAFYHAKLRGDILLQKNSDASSVFAVVPAPAVTVRQQHINSDNNIGAPTLSNDDDIKSTKSYYIFLQKFPLESSFRMIFHTEVIVCPRETFVSDVAFLNLIDGLVENILSPSRFDIGNAEAASSKGNIFQDSIKVPFISIEREYWSKQTEPGCVQLGYGGADCNSACCGSPHRIENKKYALNSQKAVIGNAMGDYKELYLYGVSGGRGKDGISGEDAYKAVCHGHMNAIEIGKGKFPVCVSNWSGHDYNPLTNNCNTFTSTLLKCVYGLSDAKPHLGISDLRTVTCPTEKNARGIDVEQCLIPGVDAGIGSDISDETTALLALT